MIFLLLLALSILCGTSAQAQDDPSLISVDVNVVNLFATVRDKNGRIVNDLSAKDFMLEENGKKQDIRYFSRQSEMPLTLGILVDTSASMSEYIPDERRAAVLFLNQVLRPEKDKAFVIQFAREAELVQSLTDSKELLRTALESIEAPRMRRGGGQWPRRAIPSDFTDPAAWIFSFAPQRPPVFEPQRKRVGTVLYDAIYLAAKEMPNTQGGERKALIVLTDGMDAGSKVNKEKAIEAAHRNDAIVFSIRYDGRGGGLLPMLFGAGSPFALGNISDKTGGHKFDVSGKQELEKIFATIEEELRNQYSIGFAPTDKKDTGYRKLRLRTTNKDLEVSTREGYYLKSAEASSGVR